MKRDVIKYAFWLSVISIVCTLVINLKISQDYFESTGKNRAFFPITAVISYIYQYYIALLGLTALVLVFFFKDNKPLKRRKLLVAGLAVFSIILVFIELWRMFVWVVE